MGSFDSITGMQYAVNELRRISSILRNPDAYLRAGLELPKGLLITGESGVGKTTLAKAFLQELGRPAYLLRREWKDGDLCEKIREVFDEAREHPGCVVFIDDIEEIDREDFEQDEDDTMRYCLDELGDSNIFLLATAVKKEAISKLILNTGRFSLHLKVTKPIGTDSRYLFRERMALRPLQGDINPDDIAWMLAGKTCGELEKVLDSAAFFAEGRQSPMMAKEDILNGYLIDTLGSSFECADPCPEAAWREAGRVVLAELLHPAAAGFSLACQYDMESRHGFTICDRQLFTSNENVMVCLAGRAAYELKYAEPDEYAENDMKRAVREMKELLSIGSSENLNGLNAAFLEAEAGERIAERQKAIQCELNACYQKVQRMLCLNWDFVETCVRQVKM